MDVKNETDQDIDYKVASGGPELDEMLYLTENAELIDGSPLGTRSITGQFTPPGKGPWRVLFQLRHGGGETYTSAWFDELGQVVRFVELEPGTFKVFPEGETIPVARVVAETVAA